MAVRRLPLKLTIQEVGQEEGQNHYVQEEVQEEEHNVQVEDQVVGRVLSRFFGQNVLEEAQKVVHRYRYAPDAPEEVLEEEHV